jgi:hypothetical protein
MVKTPPGTDAEIIRKSSLLTDFIALALLSFHVTQDHKEKGICKVSYETINGLEYLITSQEESKAKEEEQIKQEQAVIKSSSPMRRNI